MSIKDHALRVSLTVTKPQLSAKDDKATHDAEEANNARGAGQYRKDLYPKHLIAPISEVESAARAFIARRTLDFVLPVANFMQFAEDMAKFEVQFNQAVTVFLNNYTKTMTEAQQTQGGLFDPTLYPDLSSLRSRFSWNVTYTPISDSSLFAHILAPMEQAAAAQLTAHITKQVRQENDSLTSAAVAKLQRTIADFAHAMGRPDRTVISKKTGGVEVRPPIMRDAVKDNIEECIAMLNDYIDALPPSLGPIMAQASAQITSLKMDELRADPEQRKQAQTVAHALLNDINSMFAGDLPAPAPAAEPANLANYAPATTPVAPWPFGEPATEEPAQGDLLSAIQDMEDF